MSHKFRSIDKLSSLSSGLALLASVLMPLQTHAGLRELMSSGASYLATGGQTCEHVDEIKAMSALTTARITCSKGTDMPESIGLNMVSVNHLAGVVYGDAESGFFGTLALQHSKELKCASGRAQKIADGEPSSLKDLKEKLKLLRAAKQNLLLATEELNARSDIHEKTCPSSLSELKSNPFAIASTGQDDQMEICKRIITNRLAAQTIEGSIPISGMREVQKLMDRYSGERNESEFSKIEASLDDSIKYAYQATSNAIRKESNRLSLAVSIHGGTGFDRAEKIALLSDPAVVEAVVRTGGDERSMRAIACSADGRYGSGAKALETSLLVGSLLLSGGAAIAARGATVAARSSAALSTARATGILSLRSATVLRIATAGIDATALLEQVDNNCPAAAGRTLSASGTNGSQSCVSDPTAEQLSNDACILQTTLTAIGFTATVAPWLSKAPKTAKQFHPTRLSEVEMAFADVLAGLPKDDQMLVLLAQANQKGWSRSRIAETIKKLKLTCARPK